MYREGEKTVPSGMAGWFSVENWADGKQVGEDGKMIEVIRVWRLKECLKTFTNEEWLKIMQEALELRADMNGDAQKKRRRRRRNPSTTIPEEPPANVVNDNFDYHDLRSDPIEPEDAL